jgi:formylglycine-generating enzyme required for sulfatase activity
MRRATFLGFAIVVTLFTATAGARPVEDGGAAAIDGGGTGVVLTIGDATFRFRHVPRGTFRQGSPATDKWHEADETEHETTLTQDFDMLETPVTRGQFATFVGETGYVTEAEKGASGGSGWNGTELVQKKEYNWRNPGFPQTETHPVVLVTFADALAFVSWFSAKTARAASLPTEAQWERAARGGTVTAWYVGDDESAALTIGVFKTNGGQGTTPVGTHVPNAYGLHDMSGNVWEWCSDVYAPYPAGAVTDPYAKDPPPGEPLRRVLRGGSWLKEPKRARSPARYRNTPGSRNADNGFRIVLEPGASLAGVPPLASAAPRPTVTPGTPGTPSGTASPAAPERGFLDVVLSVPGIAGIFAVFAAILWLAFRNQGRPPRETNIVPAADGFRLRIAGASPGTRVRYDCMVNGSRVTDVVPLGDGSETFIYTGGTPTAIRVLEVLDPRARPDTRRAPPHEPPPRRYDDDDDDRPFGGFPSAY